jgi:hypothetical protein
MVHSTALRGGACHRSSKASRREDLEIEQPVACGDCAAFDLHKGRRTFGQTYANALRHRRPRLGDKWHLVQRRRDKPAAKKFFRKLLNRLSLCSRVATSPRSGRQVQPIE